MALKDSTVCIVVNVYILKCFVVMGEGVASVSTECVVFIVELACNDALGGFGDELFVLVIAVASRA